MKKISLALWLLGIFLNTTLFAQRESVLVHDFPAANIQKVNVQVTSATDINVQGNDTGETKVVLFLRQNNGEDGKEGDWSEEKMQESFNKHYSLDVKVENGTLHVLLKRKPIRSWIRLYQARTPRPGFSVMVNVSVKRETNLQVNTNGSITVANIADSLVAYTDHGYIKATDCSGKISLTTDMGSMALKNIDGTLKAITDHGYIKVTDCSGKISLTTDFGSMALKNIDGTLKATADHGYIQGTDCRGIFLLETDRGDIKLSNMAGSLEAKTDNGNISVEMAAITDYVTLSSRWNVSLVLPKEKGYDVKIKAERISLKKGDARFNGSATTKNVEGIINEGGVPVKIQAHGGAQLILQ